MAVLLLHLPSIDLHLEFGSGTQNNRKISAHFPVRRIIQRLHYDLFLVFLVYPLPLLKKYWINKKVLDKRLESTKNTPSQNIGDAIKNTH